MVRDEHNDGLSAEDRVLLEGTFTDFGLFSQQKRFEPLATIHSAKAYDVMDLSVSDSGVDVETLLADIDAYLQHSVKPVTPIS